MEEIEEQEFENAKNTPITQRWFLENKSKKKKW